MVKMFNLSKIKFFISEIIISISGISGIEIFNSVPLSELVKIFWQSMIGCVTILFMYLSYRKNKKIN